MTVSSSDPAHADMLDSDVPSTPSRRPSSPALLAAGVAVVLTVAFTVQATQRNDSAAVESEAMSGSLTLSGFRSTTVPSPFEGAQERNAHGSGSVHLDLPDRELDGLAEVDFSGSFQGPDVPVEGEPASAHLWGDIRLTFGSNACRGSFAWSSFTTPPEGGGSMHARCEDGATLAATVAATRLEASQELSVDLRDGWYVAGPEEDD